MSTTNKLDTLLTPMGDIKFMALNQPVKKYSGDGMEYVIRLQFSTSGKADKEFRKTVEGLNAAKIVTTQSDANPGNTVSDKVEKGTFQVSFKTSFIREDGTLAQPVVLDLEGNRLTGDAIPQFYSNVDSGMAKVEAAISKQGKRPTLYLRQAAIMSLKQGERPEQTAQESELMAALKATHAKNKVQSA